MGVGRSQENVEIAGVLARGYGGDWRMVIGITGVTGFIGRHLAMLARERGHEVIGFSRNPPEREAGWRRMEGPRLELAGCEAVVNLAGESVMGLWTKGKRRAIRESRLEGARWVAAGVPGSRVRVVVSGSATGIYGDTGGLAVDETGAHGRGFLAEVCEAWEGEAGRVKAGGVRLVLARTGIVLGRDGGALKAMLPVFRMGLGGPLGNGRQWMSWIHVKDAAELMLEAVENEAYEGPVNVTAPFAEPNAVFTKTLARALGMPAAFRVPAIVIKAAAGGFAAELLESRRVLPGAAQRAGFVFQYPELERAVVNLVTGM